MSEIAPPDPAPLPPEKPLASDCCDSGCARCVFEIYAEQRAQYRQDLASWRARQTDLDT
jgi:hypothetical protein